MRRSETKTDIIHAISVLKCRQNRDFVLLSDVYRALKRKYCYVTILRNISFLRKHEIIKLKKSDLDGRKYLVG